MPYWDTGTMMLYIAMGLIPFAAVSLVKKKEATEGVLQPFCSWPYMAWLAVWVVFATCRFVGPGIGGADASSYIHFFEVCLEPSYLGFEWGNHMDSLYALFNKVIRLLTDDYHVLFALVYALLVVSYLLVVNRLGLPRASYVPLIFLVFIYVRGFNTIRSNVAAALILISMALFFGKRYRGSVVFAISSVFVHKMSILYVLYIPVLGFFRSRAMGIRECIFLLVAMAIAGSLGQLILTSFDMGFFESGAYSYYVGRSSGVSFFDNFWKIAFPQLLLLAAIAFFRTPVKCFISALGDDLEKRARFVYRVCLFDIATIPATFILGIWRGYEFLCIFRLLMWGIIIEAICGGMNSRQRTGVRLIAGAAFIAWLVFRQYNTFEDALLMPYVFAPLLS